MMSRMHRGISGRMPILLPAIVVMVMLTIGTMSSATTVKAWAQGQQQQPQPAQSSTGDIKSKAKEVENAVISALKAYATAVGAKYIDLDLLTQVPPTAANNTGGVPTVVNQTAYTDATNMIAKAQDQLNSLSQTANPQQAVLIAKVQGGVEALKTMIERKAAFNLTEDVAQSPVVNNLRQLS